MPIINYRFDDDDFEYEVDWDDVKQVLYEHMFDNWSHEETIDYILSNDGCTTNLLEDFKEEIHDAFKHEAEEFYYECKNSDNGVDQGDFI